MQRYPSNHSKILHFQFWICRYQRPLLHKYSPSTFVLAEVRLLQARIYGLWMSYQGFNENIELEGPWNFKTLHPKYKIEIHLRWKRRNHRNKRPDQCEFIKWSMNKGCSNANIQQIKTSFDQGSTLWWLRIAVVESDPVGGSLAVMMFAIKSDIIDIRISNKS